LEGNDECTVGVCSHGTCVARPVRCPERLPCTPPCLEDQACVSGACLAKCDNASKCASGLACRDGACQDGCFLDDECDDGRECTTDQCDESATCSHTETSGSCANGGGLCCSGECFIPKCVEDLACNDRNPCTRDTCLNPGTCENQCRHTPICGEDCGPCQDPDVICCDGLCTMPECQEDGDCAGLPEICKDPGTCTADCVICDDADCLSP
jgi:hypothetical protein